MKNIVNILIVIILTLFFLPSCLKEKSLMEEEDLMIEKYKALQDIKFIKDTSGIYYYVYNEGIGNYIENGSLITIAYEGKILKYSGKNVVTSDIFSESENFSFTVGDEDIIEGWNIAAKLFKEGTIATVIIPFNLAYGGKEVGTVPQYSTLIFDFRIISTNPAIESDVDFYNYIYNLDSITSSKTDSVYYTSFFEGIGNQVYNGNSINIEYTLYNLEESELEQHSSFNITVGSNTIIQGIDFGITYFKEGGMGRLVIPYQQAYGESANGNIPAFANLIYEIRVLSNDLQVMEHSNLHKYFHENDTIGIKEISGLYYLKSATGTGDSCSVGDTVIINYSAFLIPTLEEFERCDTCEFILDSPDLPRGVNQGLKLMQLGTKAKLILPSILGFGSEQHGIVPPYSNLIYEIEILEILN